MDAAPAVADAGHHAAAGADRLAALARFRRMLGVFTFSYASLHLLAYGWLDMGLDFGDIATRHCQAPLHPDGFTAWALMVPLAATSFNKAISPGRQALAGAAQGGLRRRRRWLAALHLDALRQTELR